jgi:acyl-CoA synthetase (AMP-forming)/AMP-acid ligase II
MNLAHLLLRSARWLPERPAIAVGTTPFLSYGELALRVARLASGFKSRLSLKRGDRVALAMKNCPEYHQVLFACWHAGLTAVPMNAKLHPKEFAYILENSGARACFVTPDLGTAVPNGISTQRLNEFLDEPGQPADVAFDDPAWLFYTSGTTGVPKGAVLTHRNLMFQTHAYFADIDPLGPGDAILHPAPLSHGSGCYALPHFAAGAVNVIPGARSSPRRPWWYACSRAAPRARRRGSRPSCTAARRCTWRTPCAPSSSSGRGSTASMDRARRR